MKKQDIYKGYKDCLDEFSHKFACWANRRNQWSKDKKQNKKLAKHREKFELNKEMKDYYE